MRDRIDSVCRGFFAGVFIGSAALSGPARATDVTSFELGYPGAFYPPATLHGTYAFSQIRVAFDTDVYVDAYDLHLYAVADPAACSLPISGFSYDSTNRSATWTLAGQPVQQNERFLAVLSGIWATNGVALTGGQYTNEFSVLSGDVSGDDYVTPLDSLLIINYLNNPIGERPDLDVNLDGAVTPLDTLIVINMINAAPGGQIDLVSGGSYLAVTNDPPPALRFANVASTNSSVYLQFSGLPLHSLALITGKTALPDATWYPVLNKFVTNESSGISFPMIRSLTQEFYQVQFQ